MALKKTIVVISAEGRDKGKQYVITEAPCAVQEDFAMRAFFAALNAGAEVPDGVAEMGIPGLMAMGAAGLAKIPYTALKPLLDEMMDCVQYQPDPSKEHFRAPTYDGDIEELSTRLTLRKAIFDLHVSFMGAADQSTTVTAAQQAATS